MGLDYKESYINFRDFGGYLNLISNKQLLPEKRFYRGGSIETVLK